MIPEAFGWVTFGYLCVGLTIVYWLTDTLKDFYLGSVVVAFIVARYVERTVKKHAPSTGRESTTHDVQEMR